MIITNQNMVDPQLTETQQQRQEKKDVQRSSDLFGSMLDSQRKQQQQFDKVAAFLSGRMPQGAPLMGIARVRVCPSRDKGARALGLTVIGGADQRVMPIASVFWGHAERQEKPHSFGIAAGSCLTQRLY